jgi:hypothetical protein
VLVGTDRYSPGEHLGAGTGFATSVPLPATQPAAAAHFDRVVTADRDRALVDRFARSAATLLGAAA